MSKVIEHKVGQIVTSEQVDVGQKVERLKGKTFKVFTGSSCTMCALSGLGHKTCKEVACSRDERSDGYNVVYVEKVDE